MKPKNSINAILDALGSRQHQGETSSIFRIQPSLIQDAMNALHGYRKLFAPVIPGLTDTGPIYAAYEQMRQRGETTDTILLLVECQTVHEFHEAVSRLPFRESLRRAQEFWRLADPATENSRDQEQGTKSGAEA